MHSINLLDKLQQIAPDEFWQPKVIGDLNNYQIKLVRLQGEFVWHDHADTDELFLCVEGEFEMHYQDHIEAVRTGEMVVVPKGVAHKPVAHGPCSVLLIEPVGVVNTGATQSDLTAPQDVRI
ncbi:MAG: cupin domain-containing protein [Pseudomonadota bacterium]